MPIYIEVVCVFCEKTILKACNLVYLYFFV